MKLLILGKTGMLGHELMRHLASNHDVVGTTRDDVDARETDSVADFFRKVSPDCVINAIGVVKQGVDDHDESEVIEINSRFPHRLLAMCEQTGARLIHISTDCVFSGKVGMYKESDSADATDLYGRSKLDGELHDGNCLTLRTSMIGLELNRKSSLIEWFLAQEGSIKGYRRAVFSGFTTAELARIIQNQLLDQPEKSGLYHVSSEAIDKFTLLSKLRDRLDLDLEIIPDENFECDRSLDSTRFRRDFGYTPPTWDAMLDELSEMIKARQR